MNKKILTALACAALVGCQTAGPLPGRVSSPTAQNQAQNTLKQTSVQTPTLVNRSTDVRKLPLHLRRMIDKARKHMATDEFKTSLRQGQSQFSTLNPGGFSTQSARQGDTKMYAVGGTALNTTNGQGMDRIFEYNYQTHAMTMVGFTNNIASAAVAKHPTTGHPYFLESYTTGSRRLYSMDPATGTPTLVGDLALASTTVQMAFSRAGTLYVFTGGNELYEVNHLTGATTLVPLSGATGGGSGDIAFEHDDSKMYRIDGNGNLFLFDLNAGTSTSLGQVTGITSGYTIAGLGINTNNELLALGINQGGSSSQMYRINRTTLTATTLQTYSDATTFPLADLSSAGLYQCPDVSAGRPETPTMLFDDNFASFSGMAGSFANLPGESNTDTTTGWKQWNTDYFAHAGGVTPWNPGVGNGDRNNPGEYGPGGSSEDVNDPRPNLLETAISRELPLNYAQGDKLIAKVNVSPTFTDDATDTTVMLCFDDPAQTIAVSNTIRGKDVSGGEMYVEAEIPSCATKVVVIPLAYLGENETSSLTFQDASLEFIPKDYYTTSSLLNETFDTTGTHATYGTNFPTNFDEQFGSYDIYTVTNWPEAYSGDLAATAANPDNSAIHNAGLVKQVPLTGYNATDKLNANLYVASTFSHRDSEVTLHMEFYNASNTKLGQVSSSKVTDSQFRWANIDRASIPTGTTYVKLVPTIRLAATESSSFLMDNLKLNLLSENVPTVTSVTLNSPANGSSYASTSSVSLSATPDRIIPGMTVEFYDGATLIATGTQSGSNFVATLSNPTTGSHPISAVVKDSGGTTLATSATHTITVTTPSVTLTAPAANSSHVRKTNVTLSATASNVPNGGSVQFEVSDGSSFNDATAPYSATWKTPNVNSSTNYTITAQVLDSAGSVVATHGPITVTVTKN